MGRSFFLCGRESNPTLTNVLIAYNSGLNGAVCVWNDANPTFNHITIANNGIYDNEIGLESGFHNEFSNRVVTITNSIFGIMRIQSLVKRQTLLR